MRTSLTFDLGDEGVEQEGGVRGSTTSLRVKLYTANQLTHTCGHHKCSDRTCPKTDLNLPYVCYLYSLDHIAVVGPDLKNGLEAWMMPSLLKSLALRKKVFQSAGSESVSTAKLFPFQPPAIRKTPPPIYEPSDSPITPYLTHGSVG